LQKGLFTLAYNKGLKTGEDIAEVMLMDLLYRAMMDYLDNVPTQMRISPLKGPIRSMN
jgi:hypothetical protein